MVYAHKKMIDTQIVLETLQEHSEKTLSYLIDEQLETSFKLLKRYMLSLKDVYTDFFELDDVDCLQEVFFDMLKFTIANHDIAKQTSSFQKYLIHNERYYSGEKNHSLKGAYHVYNYLISDDYANGYDEKYIFFIEFFAFTCYLLIARHHTILRDFNIDFFEKEFLLFQESEQKYYEEFSNFPHDSESFLTYLNCLIDSKLFNNDFYTLLRYLRGVLSHCDHLATANFFNGLEFVNNRFTNSKIETIRNNYLQSDFNKYTFLAPANELNKIRNEFVQELDVNFPTLKNCVHYLEAPTGSGKTHLSLRYVLKSLKEGQKVIYATQFNSVSEQTFQVYQSILSKDLDRNSEGFYNVLLNNSNAEIHHDLEENSYDLSLLRNDLLEYEFSLISNQRLLNILFAEHIKDAKAFQSLRNSIIVIDELQNIDVNIWKSLINVLNTLVQEMGCKVLLMSATLPEISKIQDTEYDNVIKNQSLIQNDIFKSRVIFKDDFLYHRKDVLNVLRNKINEYSNKRVLVEFVIKKTAKEFYKEFTLAYPEKTVFLMTGDTSTKERLEIINKLCEKTSDGSYALNDVVLIATQVIEAGVDIDMQVGFKDVSKISSELQFAGRINRNNSLEKGIVYFFNYNNVDFQKDVYEKSYQIPLREYFDLVSNHNYKNTFNKIIENIKKDDSFLVIDKALKTLSYTEAVQKIKIKNLEVRILYQTEENKELLSEYFQVLSNDNLGFSEKRILLSRLLPKLNEEGTIVKNTKDFNRDVLIQIENNRAKTIIRDSIYLVSRDFYEELAV